MKKHVLITFTILTIASLFTFMKNDKPYEFILGHWYLEKNNIRVEEYWEVKNDVYTGWSKTWKDTSIISSESVAIIEENESVYYVVNVSGHNDDKPVRFKLVETGTEKLVFENKEHDFPQRIIYTRINRNEMLAQIEGEKGGKIKTIDFAYTRIKD